MNTSSFLWIEELRILRSLSPLLSEEVRRIQFRRGLNIIWADATGQTELELFGFGGHAAGKTSLCRLLRFVLGEMHYGSRFMRDRILNGFQDGWVTAKIWVNGTPWIVARAFRSSYHPLAIQTDVFKRIFDTVETPGRFDDFKNALEDAVVAQFPVQTFPSENEPITFSHLLEWLARDQECRLSGLLDWRHETSNHGSPKMSAEQRRFLIRDSLGLVDDLVRDEIESRNPLEAELNRVPVDTAFEQRGLRIGLRALQAAVAPEPIPDIADTLFVDSVERIVKNKRDIQIAGIDKAISDLHLPSLQETFNQYNQDLGAKTFQESELQEHLAKQQTSLREAQRDGTVAAFDRFWENLKPTDQYCRVPIMVARFRCPLRQEFEPAAKSPSLKVDFSTLATEAKKVIGELELALKPIREAKQKLATEVENLRSRISYAENRIESLRTQRTEIIQAYTLTLFRANEAVDACRRIEELESRQLEIEKKVEESKLKQEALQARQKKQISDFSNLYESTLQAFLGTGITAGCRFTREEISLHADYLGELSSGAIDTLKVLALDIAVMHASLLGTSHHPRFIVFDSPREADMHPALYRRLFHHLKSLEESESSTSFQVIITTTEPPPKDLQEPPNLILMLNASRKEDRLYRTNFEH